MIEEQGVRLRREVAVDLRPRRQSRGGSSTAPRKANTWNGNQQELNSTHTLNTHSFIKKHKHERLRSGEKV
ncbi:hypothetical protein AB685_18920 [Bacillus sp. LL01]|nr:hypothetical protein AB685_18920 [Bacillus sp. LL01]